LRIQDEVASCSAFARRTGLVDGRLPPKIPGVSLNSPVSACNVRNC
jgi:hypothetical protein